MRKIIAFDIGGTNMRAAIVDENNVIEKSIIESTLHDSTDVFLNQVASLVEKIGMTDDIVAISMGVPGKVRWDGYVYELPNIGIKNIPLGEFINTKFRKTTYVRNDAEMAGLGESTVGAGEGYRTIYFVTISTGVGGAMVRDHKVVVPSDEIGHTLVNYNGQYYEFEKLFSGNGLKNLCLLNGLTVANAQEFFSLKQNNDPLASKVYDIWVKGVADFLNFIKTNFEIDAIILSGGVIKSSNIFLDDLKKLCPTCTLLIAKNKQDAGLIGSAYYGLHPQD
jgi:glucokinase